MRSVNHSVIVRNCSKMLCDSAAEDSATQRMKKLLLRRKVFNILSNDDINPNPDHNRPSLRQLTEVTQFGQCACAEGCACAKVFRRRIVSKMLLLRRNFPPQKIYPFGKSGFLCIFSVFGDSGWPRSRTGSATVNGHCCERCFIN